MLLVRDIAVFSVCERLREEANELEASVGYTSRPYLSSPNCPCSPNRIRLGILAHTHTHTPILIFTKDLCNVITHISGETEAGKVKSLPEATALRGWL